MPDLDLFAHPGQLGALKHEWHRSLWGRGVREAVGAVPGEAPALNGDAAQGPAPGHVSDGAHNRATGYVNQRQSVFSEIRNNRHELPVQ